MHPNDASHLPLPSPSLSLVSRLWSLVAIGGSGDVAMAVAVATVGSGGNMAIAVVTVGGGSGHTHIFL